MGAHYTKNKCESTVSEQTEEKEDLEAEIIETAIKKYKKEIKEAEDKIAANKKAMLSASQTREAENKEFQQIVQDQRAAQTILTKALKALKSFYDKKALIQQKQGDSQTPPVQFMKADVKDKTADRNRKLSKAGANEKLCIKEVQGRNCVTDVHALELTRDKRQALIRKWHMHVDMKTKDGSRVRMFCLAVTKKQPGPGRNECYAQTTQIREIRKKLDDM